MENNYTCPFCGAPMRRYYEGSSDWTYVCSSAANKCGVSLTFWVRGFPDESAEADRRFFSRRPPMADLFAPTK